LGLPATVFLVTGHVGSEVPFWWEEVATRLRRAEPGVLKELVGALGVEPGDATRPHDVAAVIARLKYAPADVRARALGRLRQTSPAVTLARTSLSWEEVGTARAWGIRFGSHSVSHPNLTRLEDDRLAEELEESRQVVEARAGGGGRVLAYPNGDHDRRV